MSLAHRPVAEADLPLICRFPRDQYELFYLFPRAIWPLDEAQLRRAISERTESTVATLDGRTVAFANFYQWQHNGVCSIGNVMVAPDVRRRGVGDYIVRTMADLAFERYAAESVQISCFNRNAAGLLLYTKIGFHPFAVEEKCDPRGNRVALIHLRMPRREAEHHLHAR